jgi:hypothetical protein
VPVIAEQEQPIRVLPMLTDDREDALIARDCWLRHATLLTLAGRDERGFPASVLGCTYSSRFRILSHPSEHRLQAVL